MPKSRLPLTTILLATSALCACEVGPNYHKPTAPTPTAYKQIDGAEALTVFDEKKHDQAERVRLEGEIRVRADDFVPLQITLSARTGEVSNTLREEAAVTYKMSNFGALLPASTEHQELRNNKVVAQNKFNYSDFHKFGAASDIKFDAK